MARRNPFDDALNPREEAFLKKGVEKPKVAAETKLPPEKPDRSAVERAGGDSAAPALAGVSFALNTRLAAHLSNALLRASTDRQLQRLASSTQRAIVEEALSEWLKKHGYLR